jgi:hypothetical protein
MRMGRFSGGIPRHGPKRSGLVSLSALMRHVAAAMVLSFANLSMAVAEVYTSPPMLIDFYFNPAVVDLVSDRAEVEANLELSDALSGVGGVSCLIESPSGWIHIGTGTAAPSSGDRSRGVFTILFHVPQYLEEGNWHVDYCRAADQVGNLSTWTYPSLTALGFEADFHAGFLPGRPTAAISSYMDEKHIRGNSFTVKAELTQGGPEDVSPTLGVRFDVRPLPSGSFVPIHPRHLNQPNPDVRYPYFTHWDVSIVPDGDYELRAVAYALDGTADPSPETIRMTIDHSGAIDIDENFTSDSIQESRTAVDDGMENYVVSGDWTATNSAAEIFIPEGALIPLADTAILSFPDPAGEAPLLDPIDRSLGMFIEFSFQSGETNLEEMHRADLLVSYSDYDQDGYLDGTDIRESHLEMRYFDPIAGVYKRFRWRVLPEHNMVHVSTPFSGRFAVVPAPWRWMALENAQRACIDEMGKSGAKVNQLQLKENERCLMDFQNGKLVAPMTFDGCMTADRKGRVQRAEDKMAVREASKCDPIDAPPRFTHVDSETVGTAAVEGALELNYQIFGEPSMVEANLATKADDKDVARCQLEMLKRAGKVESAVVKELNKVTKRALKDETVDSDAALENALWSVFSSNDKVERAQGALDRGVDRKCAAVQAAPASVFPGSCGEGDPSLSEVEACVIAAARCVACVKVNAFDDLKLDCDQADDGGSNESCPFSARDSGGSGWTNADCFPTSLPESAPEIAKLCVALANSAPDMPFTPEVYEGLPNDCKAIVFPECRGGV